MPAIPANFAALASSLPRRGSWEPSLSRDLVPSFPENPGSLTASGEAPSERAFFTIEDSQDDSDSEISWNSMGTLDLAAIATLFSIVISVFLRS